jgi:hypothetical protein
VQHPGHADIGHHVTVTSPPVTPHDDARGVLILRVSSASNQKNQQPQGSNPARNKQQ